MESKYTIGVFIDLSKTFDAINQKIVIEKRTMYGVKDGNLQWFESYLPLSKKQYIVRSKTEPHIEIPYAEFLKDLFWVHYYFYST